MFLSELAKVIRTVQINCGSPAEIGIKNISAHMLCRSGPASGPVDVAGLLVNEAINASAALVTFNDLKKLPAIRNFDNGRREILEVFGIIFVRFVLNLGNKTNHLSSNLFVSFHPFPH